MYQKVKAYISRPGVRVAIVMGAMLLCALCLRLYGIVWDQGQILHPDEHSILAAAWRIHLPDWPPSLSQLLNPDESPLNPRFFGYGSLPIYLLKAVGSILSNFNESLSEFDLRLVGRGMNAVLDTGTILLVFLLGRRLYSNRVGILAALFATFTVLSIQQAHFCTVDSMLTFFIALTVLLSVRAMSNGTRRTFWVALPIGIGLGLAVATKMTAFVLVAVIVTAYVLRCFEGDGLARSSFRAGTVKGSLLGLASVAVVAAVTVAVAEPYIFIDWDTFIADTNFNRDAVITGASDLAWTRQFIDTTPFLYHIRNLSIWGMGLPLSIAAWGALLFTIGYAAKHRHKCDLLLLSWILPYFLVVGTMEAKFIRYMLPLVPFLCLLAARLFDFAYQRLRGRWRMSVVGLTVLVVAASVFYSIAHVSIYAHPHPVVQATEWANATIEPDEVAAVEDWEHLLYLGPYHVERLRLFDPDTPEKMATMAQQIDEADYIIVLTNRVYGTVGRLTERYPHSSRYYELLFSGELGFELVYCATSYPSLWGVTIVDDTFNRPGLPVPEGLESCYPGGIAINMGYADETFTVFDHPMSMVFKRDTDLTQEEILDLLMATDEQP